MLDDWVLDVPDKQNTRYLLCSEHLDTVPDRSKTCSLDCCKAYSRYLRGIVDYGIKYEVSQKINLEVMLIQIGKAVPSIGRALQGVALVWD